MNKITFEELAQRFPLRNVAPYGACVVVPGAEFDPDWEVALGDAAHGLVCCECGSPLPGSIPKDRDELSAKQRAYYVAHRDELRVRQREANRRWLQRKREKLQKLAENSRMEVSK